jgi:uncharacterized protein YndB with AHSA1/START domain
MTNMELLLVEFGGTASTQLDANPQAVFDLLVDPARLPGWNECIQAVLDAPVDPLQVGDDWVVRMRAMGRTWPSRSHAVVVDRIGLRFSYRSSTDDANPSYVQWAWQVSPREGGSTLTVAWSAHPATFWRRLVLARVRRPVLAREVRASLGRIGAVLATAPTPLAGGVKARLRYGRRA